MADTLASNEFKDIAIKLFKEEFVSIQPEEYIQFLASTDEDSNEIRSYYMDLFDWDPNLLKATRTLCSKLYLKGESQEIDRILTSFTKSYIKQNPVNIFCTKNFEKIYIVLYSLVLLNTSLHNHEVNKKSKISQSDYIKNTFTTFIQQDSKTLKKLSIRQRIIIEKELGNYYDDLARHELQLKTTLANNEILDSSKPSTTTTTATTTAKSNLNGGSNPVTTPNVAADTSIGSITTQATTKSTVNEANLTRQISNSSIWSTDNRNSMGIKRTPSNNSSASQMNGNRVGFTRALISDQNNRLYQQNNSSNLFNGSYARGYQPLEKFRNEVNRKSSRASIISRGSVVTQQDDLLVVSFDSVDMNHINLDDSPQQDLDNFNINEFQDNYDLILELQGSPYLKEGILKLKILNNDQQDNNVPEQTTSSAASTTSTVTSTASRFFSFFRRANPIASEPTNSLNSYTNPLNNKFVEYFVVVSKGELNLYSFDPKIIKKHQLKLKRIQRKKSKGFEFLHEDDEYDEFDSTFSSKDVGDGNWLNNAANVGNYNLCSTFAQLEKSHSKKNSFNNETQTFSVTFPKISKKPAKILIFEAGTKEIALEFINTCNFWASKITAVPTLEESVSSIEYGWNNLDSLIANRANFKKLKTIHKWEVLPTGVYLSSYNYSTLNENHYNMMKQFIKTLNYYNNLKKQFRDFNELRIKFFKNLGSMSGSSSYSRILSNFEAKLAQYKFDLKKYKNYLIILGFALQLRFDLEDEEKADEDTQIEDAGETNIDESPRKLIVSNDEDYVSVKDSEVKPEEDNTVKEEPEDKPDISDGETDLSRLVKYEIRKLFIGLRDVGKIIPTFQTSKSISNLNALQHQIPNLSVSDINNSFNLVKSPKHFTLSNFNEDESPVTGLMKSSKKDILHSYSTNTIQEEDEEEPQRTQEELAKIEEEDISSPIAA